VAGGGVGRVRAPAPERVVLAHAYTPSPRQLANNSYPSIGEKLGGRDHTTVMYACEKLHKELEKNETLQQELSLIKERMYSKN